MRGAGLHSGVEAAPPVLRARVWTRPQVRPGPGGAWAPHWGRARVRAGPSDRRERTEDSVVPCPLGRLGSGAVQPCLVHAFPSIRGPQGTAVPGRDSATCAPSCPRASSLGDSSDQLTKPGRRWVGPQCLASGGAGPRESSGLCFAFKGGGRSGTVVRPGCTEGRAGLEPQRSGRSSRSCVSRCVTALAGRLG